MNAKFHGILTKLSTLPNAQLDPNGAATGGIINDGYIVKGYYNEPPTLDKAFSIFRYERNGIKADGIMTTSAVRRISCFNNQIEFHTDNSIYKLEIL